MSQYRRKTEVVESVQITAEMLSDFSLLPDWAKTALVIPSPETCSGDPVVRFTWKPAIAGDNYGYEGDFLIHDGHFQVHTCREDEFLTDYEKVNDDNDTRTRLKALQDFQRGSIENGKDVLVDG
jgi:hypothetical protein